jgi:hypothetical protein
MKLIGIKQNTLMNFFEYSYLLYKTQVAIFYKFVMVNCDSYKQIIRHMKPFVK